MQRRGRKPYLYIIRRREREYGKPWYAKRNGYHPNGKLTCTWVAMERLDDQCHWTKVEVEEIRIRQAELGFEVSTFRVEFNKSE